jgi:hypothetical protein
MEQNNPISSKPSNSSPWLWILIGCGVIILLGVILFVMFGAGIYYWIVSSPSITSITPTENTTTDYQNSTEKDITTASDTFDNWQYLTFDNDKFVADFPATPVIEASTTDSTTTNSYTADDPDDATTLYSIYVQHYNFDLKSEKIGPKEVIDSMVVNSATGAKVLSTQELDYPPYQTMEFEIQVNDQLHQKGMVVINGNTVYKVFISFPTDKLDTEKYDHFIYYFEVKE